MKEEKATLPPARCTQEQRQEIEKRAKAENRSLGQYIVWYLFKDVPVNHK